MNLYPVLPYLTAITGLLLGAAFASWRFWRQQKFLSSQIKHQRISNQQLSDQHQAVSEQLHNLQKAHDRLNSAYNRLYTELDESRNQLRKVHAAQNRYLDRISSQQEVVQQLQTQINTLQTQHIQQLKTTGVSGKPTPGNQILDSFKKKTSSKGKEQVNGKDDLKNIKGISPGIEKMLNRAGITTCTKLLQVDVKELTRMLDRVGKKTSSPNELSSWLEQAALVAKGRWQELRNWQKRREELQVLNELVK